MNNRISKDFLSQRRDGKGPGMRSEVTVVEILLRETCRAQLEHCVRGQILLPLTALRKEERGGGW